MRASYSWLAARRWIRPRLGRVLLVAAIVFGLSMVSDARAEAPVTGYYLTYKEVSYTGASRIRTSALAVCQEILPTVFAMNGWTLVSVDGTQNGKCSMTIKRTSDSYVMSAFLDGVVSTYGSWCANGTAPDASKPLDQQCGAPAPTCPSAGQTASGDSWTVTSNTQLPYGVDVCIPISGTSGGCGITASGRVGGFDKVTGKWEYQYMGPLRTTGKVCTGNGGGVTDPEKDKPRKCDAGMCTGTVNGVEICVRCAQTDTASNNTKTTTNPDGSTTQVTTNTSTTINNNSVTTTTTTITTTTPAGGGTPTTQTKTETANETKDSYCQRNPNDAGCKDLDGQASGGETCDAPPVCTGDAIQCMMVQQQWQTRCNLEREDDIVKAGRNLGTAADPMAGRLPTPDGAPQVDVGKISQDPLFSGGSLDLGKTIMVGGMQVTIDATYVTQYAELMGYVNLICTAFVCAYMLKGVF